MKRYAFPHSYSDHYPEKGIFQRLMERLRAITAGQEGFSPVVAVALTG